MGRDPNSRLHAGAIGLFDDLDEILTAERREAKAQEKEENRIEKALRKDDKRGERAAEKANRRRLEKEKGIPWWRRHLNVRRSSAKKIEVSETQVETKAPPAVPQWVINAQQRKTQREKERAEEKRKQTEVEMFDARDIDDDLDSPFYEELGLVLVKGQTPGDNRVVHKSQVRKHGDDDSDEEISDGW